MCDGLDSGHSGKMLVTDQKEVGSCGVEVMVNKPNKGHEFKDPEQDINIFDISRKKFAPQSRHKMMWAVNMYNEWRGNRIGKPGVAGEILQANLELLYTFTEHDLGFALSRFIREVKKLDGSDYPPNTIRDIIIMIQMYLHENSIYWKLLDQPQFFSLRNVVDNTMKERHSQGLGVHKSSDIISLAHEDKMFNQGILGEDSPHQLLRMMVYMIGLHCAL